MKEEQKMLKNLKQFGFTLAEVLITLAIIGVVAAITIPGLVTTIKDKVSQRQIQVAEKRLAEGVRLFSQLDSGFNGRTYEDTYDFLKNGLSKHFKMTSICDAEHIADCWPGGKELYRGSSDLYLWSGVENSSYTNLAYLRSLYPGDTDRTDRNRATIDRQAVCVAE